MNDVLALALIAVLFLAAAGLIRLCDAVRPR